MRHFRRFALLSLVALVLACATASEGHARPPYRPVLISPGTSFYYNYNYPVIASTYSYRPPAYGPYYGQFLSAIQPSTVGYYNYVAPYPYAYNYVRPYRYVSPGASLYNSYYNYFNVNPSVISYTRPYYFNLPTSLLTPNHTGYYTGPLLYKGSLLYR